MNAGIDVLSSVRERFGIRFYEVETGGGCCALEARLESGHWIVATDEGLMGFRDRVRWEREEGDPLGWSIGIYPHNGDDSDWFGVDPIVDVIHLDAFASDLPAAVADALEQLTRIGGKA